jgi:hypothetical protein
MSLLGWTGSTPLDRFHSLTSELAILLIRITGSHFLERNKSLTSSDFFQRPDRGLAHSGVIVCQCAFQCRAEL